MWLHDGDLAKEELPLDKFSPPTLGAGSGFARRSADPSPRATGAGLRVSAVLDSEWDDLWREAEMKLPLLPPLSDSSPDKIMSIKFLSSFAISARASSDKTVRHQGQRAHEHG